MTDRLRFGSELYYSVLSKSPGVLLATSYRWSSKHARLNAVADPALGHFRLELCSRPSGGNLLVKLGTDYHDGKAEQAISVLYKTDLHDYLNACLSSATGLSFMLGVSLDSTTHAKFGFQTGPLIRPKGQVQSNNVAIGLELVYFA